MANWRIRLGKPVPGNESRTVIRLMIDEGRLLTPHEANGISMLLEQMADPAGAALAAKLNHGIGPDSSSWPDEFEIVMTDAETRAMFTAIRGLPSEKISENLVALQASLATFVGAS